MLNIFGSKPKAPTLAAGKKANGEPPVDEENVASTEDLEEDAEGEEDETVASEDEMEEGAEDETEETDAEGDDLEEDAEGAEPKPDAKKASGERGRIAAILRSPSAKSFPSLADALAFDLGLGAKASLKILDAAAKDIGSLKPGASGRGAAFRDAMGKQAPNPKVGFGAVAKRTEEDEAIAQTAAVAAEFGLARPVKA